MPYGDIGAVDNVIGGISPGSPISFRDLYFKEQTVVEYRNGACCIRSVPYGMPKIPKTILSCTFYLYASEEAAREGAGFGGTGFFVGVPVKGVTGRHFIYGVTNWHVACRDGFSVIRAFYKDGTPVFFDFGPEDWQYISQGDDIAAVALHGDLEDLDFRFLALESFITQDDINNELFSVGDDAFMVGRFVDHDGGVRNAPAARFGNISMMPDGKIRTANGSLRKTFCIDMHSRTGFSGSPVFVYRTPGNDFTSTSIDFRDRHLRLLGIHWGQFPEMWELAEKQEKQEKREKRETPKRESLAIDGAYVKGLSGMTCVAPAWSIQEILNVPKFMTRRTEIEEEMNQRSKAQALSNMTPVAESSEPPATEDNPDHREDFNQLLGAAVAGLKEYPEKS